MKRLYRGLLVGTISAIFLYLIFFLKSDNDIGSGMVNLTSSSFKDGGEIPTKYTCKGENISPSLRWQATSLHAVKSYVLIVDDPDAQRVVGKTFVHWIVLLPATITELSEGASSKKGSSVAGVELLNDFRTVQYGGPCPPKGTGVHTYRFTLFALSLSSEQLRANPSFPKAPFTAEQFEDALEKNIIEKARITGTYVVNSNK